MSIALGVLAYLVLILLVCRCAGINRLDRN